MQNEPVRNVRFVLYLPVLPAIHIPIIQSRIMKSVKKTVVPQIILAIDIGGSHVKATLLDSNGDMISDYKKLPTPVPATPAAVLSAIQQLADLFPGYTHISAGFPGYVRNGIVFTAPNLGTESWQNTNLEAQLSANLGKPAKVVNDADMQGLGIVSGKGLELVITLGTGFGSALLNEGRLLPHLEIGQHPVTKSKTYDLYVGEKAMDDIGKQRWNTRMEKVIGFLKTLVNYDQLYISGGNASKLTFPLDSNISIANNRLGIRGCARLWQQD